MIERTKIIHSVSSGGNVIRQSRSGTAVLCLMAAVFLTTLCAMPAAAQDQQMVDKLMGIKLAQEQNQQKLAQYVWQETETIAIKGDVKDTKTFQVMIGPDGKQQKNMVNDQKADSGGGRQGRAKERIIEKKTAEYEQYGQDIGALAKQYTTPDPSRLMQAKQAGNVSIQPGNGTVNLVIKSFVKPNDSVTLTIAEQNKQLLSVQVNTYLTDASDVVTIAAQFAQLPDGTNHVAATQINGVSKQLTVNTQNSNYQHK
jgi:hypothetical protein